MTALASFLAHDLRLAWRRFRGLFCKLSGGQVFSLIVGILARLEHLTFVSF
jgi:hypothetical protein